MTMAGATGERTKEGQTWLQMFPTGICHLDRLSYFSSLAALQINRRLCIQGFTPAAARLLRLTSVDLGHSAAEALVRFTQHDLSQEVQRAMATGSADECRLATRTGIPYLVQLLPAQLPDDDEVRPLGEDVLLVFLDARWLKRAGQQVGLPELFASHSTTSALLTDALSPDYPILYANRAFERLTGYSAREVLGRNCRFLQDDDREQAGIDAIRSALAEARPLEVVLRNYRKDGTPFWNQLRLLPLRDEQGDVSHFVGIQEDVTALRRSTLATRARSQDAGFELRLLRDANERAQITLRSISEAVICTTPNGEIDYLNPAAEALLDLSPGDARPTLSALRFLSEHNREPAANPLVQCLEEQQQLRFDAHLLLCARGREIVVQGSAAPILGSEGEVLGAVLTLRDVSETRRITQQLARMATHDALTGLANRAEFERRLEQTLESTRERGTQHALCYIDLDKFRILNDTLGHVAGDELIKQIATLLEQQVWPRDMLARLGGDEFGLLLAHCPLDKAIDVAESLLGAVRRFRFLWQGQPFDTRISIGVVPISPSAESTIQLLSRGDVACYTAKELGGDRLHVYQAEDSESARLHEQLQRVAELAEALRHGRFRLYGQPIVPLGKAQFEPQQRFEILLRLVDRGGNLVLPDGFIPTAERYGVMDEIDRWVIHSALSSYHATFGQRGVGLTINLSGKSLSDDSLLPFIRKELLQFAVPPEHICFEITETAAISQLDRVLVLMHELQGLGCRFALDDFGSGLSSFAYLKNLPVDYLKIAGGFVRDMASNRIDYGMVAAIHQIGHIMEIETIAEGVESAEALAKLRELGVDYAQGFLLGRPRPLEEV